MCHAISLMRFAGFGQSLNGLRRCGHSDRACPLSGAKGHAVLHCKCLLVTQNGHLSCTAHMVYEPKQMDIRRRFRRPFAVLRSYFFPGRLYKLATLDALSATALNSAPVQALEVVTSEMAPAAAVARNAAIADSASLVSVMSRKSASPVVK